VISRDNPYSSSAPYERRFSLAAVRRKPKAKLLAKGITCEQCLAAKLDRSQKQILRVRIAGQTRRDDSI
jgi:hypothetical protein